MITLDIWPAVAALTAITLAISSALGLFVRLTVRTAIDKSNEIQLAKINGTYLRSAHSDLTGAEIERLLLSGGAEASAMRLKLDAMEMARMQNPELADLRREMRQLVEYAHDAVNAVNSFRQQLQGLQDAHGPQA